MERAEFPRRVLRSLLLKYFHIKNIPVKFTSFEDFDREI